MSAAEVSCDDFLGCEAFFARSYLSGSAKAKEQTPKKACKRRRRLMQCTIEFNLTITPKGYHFTTLRITSKVDSVFAR